MNNPLIEKGEAALRRLAKELSYEQEFNPFNPKVLQCCIERLSKHISAKEVLVYNKIAWTSYPISLTKLGEKVGILGQHASRAVQKLLRLKLIRITEKGKGGRGKHEAANRYVVLWHPWLNPYQNGSSLDIETTTKTDKKPLPKKIETTTKKHINHYQNRLPSKRSSPSDFKELIGVSGGRDVLRRYKTLIKTYHKPEEIKKSETKKPEGFRKKSPTIDFIKFFMIRYEEVTQQLYHQTSMKWDVKRVEPLLKTFTIDQLKERVEVFFSTKWYLEHGPDLKMFCSNVNRLGVKATSRVDRGQDEAVELLKEQLKKRGV